MVGMLSKTLIFYDAVTTRGVVRINPQEEYLVTIQKFNRGESI